MLLVSAHPLSLNVPCWLSEARTKLKQVHPQARIFYSCCGVRCLATTAPEPSFFSFHKDSLITKFFYKIAFCFSFLCVSFPLFIAVSSTFLCLFCCGCVFVEIRRAFFFCAKNDASCNNF